MELTLAEFILVVLFGSLGLVFAWAMISRALHAAAEKRALARRVICRICLHAFEDEAPGKVTACPRCGAANEKGRGRRLG